jgi:hypothetical protein
MKLGAGMLLGAISVQSKRIADFSRWGIAAYPQPEKQHPPRRHGEQTDKVKTSTQENYFEDARSWRNQKSDSRVLH